MVTFVIEATSLEAGNVNRMMYAVEELGYESINISYRPFGATEYDVIKDITGPVVFFGSLNLIKDFQRKGLSHKPFVWCDWDKLTCSRYYKEYSGQITQSKYTFLTFGDLSKKLDFIYSDSDCVFIRPNENNKSFTGAAVKRNMFDSWYRLAGMYGTPDDILCVVSERKKIDKEWRLIIVNGKVITGSLYCENGCITLEEGYDEQAAVFAESVAKRWRPHAMFVMDIAKVEDEYSVLEIGPVNGAGFYKSDIRPIVEASAEIAIKGIP